MELHKVEKPFPDNQFKKEWSRIEHEGVLSMIEQWHRENNSSRETAEDFYGLPYTSTGVYATVSNTNTQHEIIPDYFVQFFAITNNNLLVLIAWNDKEEEMHFVIE